MLKVIKDSLNPALTSDVCIYPSGSPIPPGPSAALGTLGGRNTHVISPHSDTRLSGEGWEDALPIIRRALAGSEFD